MSLGTSGSSDGTDTVSQAVNRAADAGIIPVVAAGNAGPAPYTLGSPGAAEKAITMGAAQARRSLLRSRSVDRGGAVLASRHNLPFWQCRVYIILDYAEAGGDAPKTCQMLYPFSTGHVI
jgi:subtilisin family serine protease